MNRAGLDIIQADSLEQVKGQCVYPMVAEEHREVFQALVQDVFQGKSRTLEFRMMGLKGRTCTLYTHAVPLRNDKGEIISALSVTTDITEHKLAEELLLQSEARYRRITEGITDYQYTVRIENGRAVETKHSPACVAVTGYTAEEFTADPYLWIRMVVQEDRELIQKRVEQILEGKDIPPIEHRILRKDRELRWVRDDIILYRDTSGALLSYDGVVKDITERKLAEEEREKLINELKDALAKIKTLSSMLPICSYCKKIRDDKGYWDQVDSYISRHTDTVFSHGMCPDCAQKALKELEEFKKEQGHH
jgi:PAS domain S-box-containing protein